LATGNLATNSFIEQWEHLARRQELIGWKNGMNQYSLGSEMVSYPKTQQADMF
jgi:hypothetical protein